MCALFLRLISEEEEQDTSPFKQIINSPPFPASTPAIADATCRAKEGTFLNRQRINKSFHWAAADALWSFWFCRFSSQLYCTYSIVI